MNTNEEKLQTLWPRVFGVLRDLELVSQDALVQAAYVVGHMDGVFHSECGGQESSDMPVLGVIAVGVPPR